MEGIAIKITERIFPFLFIFMTTPSHSAEFDIGLNGRVNMQGAILAKACSIEMDSRFQSIDMPFESVASMRKNGQGKLKQFSIYLTDCTLSEEQDKNGAWHYLQVTFDGSGENGLFMVGGSARGVALQITDSRNVVASPGMSMPYVRIDNRNIRLDYIMRLMSTHETLNAGEYSSVIKFRVTYY
jgi:type 1 fimbria pilin